MATQELEGSRFDRWAGSYDRSFMQRRMFAPIHQAALALHDSLAPRPRAVLDVGCGTGRLLEAAAERWPGAGLTGVDASQGMVAQAKAKHDNGTDYAFLWGDSAALPLRTAAFDAAFSTASFHHWADQAAGLREIHRVLKPGGILVLADIEVPFAFPFAKLFNWMDQARVHTPGELHQLLEQAGFSLLESRGLWALMRVRLIAARR